MTNITAEFLHRPGLAAVVALATSPRRWSSKSQLCADAGITDSTLSMALKGDRGLSEASLQALLDVMPEGVTREALILPVRARPGDLETVRIVSELRRLRDLNDDAYRKILSELGQRKGSDNG